MIVERCISEILGQYIANQRNPVTYSSTYQRIFSKASEVNASIGKFCGIYLNTLNLAANKGIDSAESH
jgi:hypothetical protein